MPPHALSAGETITRCARAARSRRLSAGMRTFAGRERHGPTEDSHVPTTSPGRDRLIAGRRVALACGLRQLASFLFGYSAMTYTSIAARRHAGVTVSTDRSTRPARGKLPSPPRDHEREADAMRRARLLQVLACLAAALRGCSLALRARQQAHGIHDRARIVGHAVRKSRVRRVPVGDVFVVARPERGLEVRRIAE